MIASADYSMITKFDGEFNIVWIRTLPGLVQQEAFQISSDENYAIFVPYQALSWTMVRLNTSDGTFNNQIALVLVTQCKSVQLSPDNSSIYLAGYSTGPVLIQLSFSDLSIITTKTHSSLQIVSIYFYSSSMLLVNSINLLNTNYQISAVDMNLSIGVLSWGIKFGWLILCSTPSTPIISMIWTPTNQAFQLLIEGGKPVFFIVNLSTGTISGSFYKSSMSQSSITTADLVYTQTTSTIYILVHHSTGFHKFEYYPSSGTFSSGMTNSAITGYFAAVRNGFTYFGGQLISNSNAYITKIIGSGGIVQQQTFTFTSTSDTFIVNTSSGYGLSSDITILAVTGVNSLTIAGSINFVSEGSYAQSASEIFRSDIVYRNGFQDTLYVQENYNGKIQFEYPWSISGTNVISSTLIPHPATGTYPSWVSLNTDYENINVIAPSYGGSNLYYFGVRSVIFGENIDKLATITVYQCLVPYWASWSYTTPNKWDTWATGYSLSNDLTSWVISSIQNSSSQNSQNNQAAQASNQNISQTLIDQNTLNTASFITTGVILSTSMIYAFGTPLGFSSSQGIWTLFNQYQLILMLPFLRSNLSKDFFVFIRNIQFVAFDFSFLKSISIMNTPNLKKIFDYEQNDQVYYENSLESGSFIVNQFSLIQVVIITIILHSCWLFISILFRWSSSKILNLKKKIFNFFNFKTYIRFAIESFLFGFISAFTEQQWSAKKSTPSRNPSNIFCGYKIKHFEFHIFKNINF